MRVLVVEDEPSLAHALRDALAAAGFTVECASDGDGGLRRALTCDYDAIVLDLMLPGIDGWTVLRTIRKSRRTPVLILTARDGVGEKVACLDSGADDYLTKPFALEELKARVRAIVRRGARLASPLVEAGPCRIDTAARVVTVAGREVSLSPKEYALLELLVMRRGTLVTRAVIYDHIWGEDDETWSNVVDVYISRLRAKLGRDLIRTRRGHGYIIDA